MSFAFHFILNCHIFKSFIIKKSQSQKNRYQINQFKTGMTSVSKKRIEIVIRPREQQRNTQTSVEDTRGSARSQNISANTSFKLDTSWTPAFIKKLKSCATILVTGPTGCGKSTQVPIAIRFAFPDARILLVQPRRLATERLAHYIASLLDTTVGNGVGFFMGRCNISDNRTQLLIATAGAAFNRLISRADEFDVIILDEIHEESPQIEQLKAVCKIAQQKYKFRLILMSATKDPAMLHEIFPSFYHFKIGDTAPSVQKTNFPVKEFYNGTTNERKSQTKVHDSVPLRIIKADALSRVVKNHKLYLEAASSILLNILIKWRQGDIIVFLPGIAAITDFITKFNNLVASWTKNRKGSIIAYNFLIVHSTCSEEYKLDFLETMSKQSIIPNVLLATNMCETSLTLPTLCYVIDTGLTRQFTLSSGRKKLVTTLTSIESMIQRKGRVGRVCPGEYHSVIHKEAFKYLSPCYCKETEVDSLPHLILLSFLEPNIEEGSSESIFSSLISELLLTSNRFTDIDIFYALRSLLASSLVIHYNISISDKKDKPIQPTRDYFKKYYYCSIDNSDTYEETENSSEIEQSSDVEKQSNTILSIETITMIKDSKQYGISERAVLPLIMRYSLDKALIYYWHFMLGLPYTGMVVFAFNAINYFIFISDLEMQISAKKLTNSVKNTALLLLAAISDPSFFAEFEDMESFYARLVPLSHISEDDSPEYRDTSAAVTLLRNNKSIYTLDGYSDGAAAAIVLALWRERFPVPTEHPTDEEANWCLVRCLSPYSLRQLELEIISCRSKLAKAGLLSEPPYHEQLLMETVYPMTNTELTSILQSSDSAKNTNSREMWKKCAESKGCTNSTLLVILRELEHYNTAYFKLCAFADILIAMDKPGTELAAYFDMRHNDNLQSITGNLHSSIERLLRKSIKLKDYQYTKKTTVTVNSYQSPIKAISVNLSNINNILRRPWEPVYDYCPESPSASLDLVAYRNNNNFQSLTFDETESLIYYLSIPSGSIVAGTPNMRCQTKITSGSYLCNGSIVALLIYMLVNDYVDSVFYQSKKDLNVFVFELRRFDQPFYRLRLDTTQKQDAFCTILVAISIILETYKVALSIFSETGERKPSTSWHKCLTDQDLVNHLSTIFGRNTQLNEPIINRMKQVGKDTNASSILCFSKVVLEFIQIPLEDDTPYLPGVLGLIELLDLSEYKLLDTMRTFEYQKGTSSVISS